MMSPSNTNIPVLIDLTHDIQVFYDPPNTLPIYRYFSSPIARDNFLQGNIWIPGMNRNRFSRNTPQEYNYTVHKRIQSYALSLSTLQPKTPNLRSIMNFQSDDQICGVKIHDADAFITAIKIDLSNPALCHQVSWLNPIKLLQEAHEQGYDRLVTSVRSITYNPTQVQHSLTLPIHSISCKHIDYYDEMDPVPTLSMLAVHRAANLPSHYAAQEEYRIALNSGSFLELDGHNPEPRLHHLVEYIKIACPTTAQYCQPISVPVI